MKNTIPLILAVLLGLAAVFAVSRVISKNTTTKEETIDVVVAVRDIKPGEIIADGYFRAKAVPQSAVPKNAIPWKQASAIAGQKALKTILAGDYIFLSDAGMTQSVGNTVGEGEWAVAIQFPSKSIVTMLQAGDEVAIIGTFNIETKVKGADLSQEAQSQKKEYTMVLFPRVRVLDVSMGASRNEDNSGTLVLALPPQQAQTLVAAQRVADLYPALRRPNDNSALNRLDAGVVDAKTFHALLEGLETVVIPKTPNVNK